VALNTSGNESEINTLPILGYFGRF
jgi:hypothetical protein